MAKRKKKNQVMLGVPEELTRTLGDTVLYPNGDETGWFFQNKNFGKKIKQDEMIVFNNESRQLCGVLKNNSAKVTFELSVSELMKFAKQVKKRQEYFNKLAKKKKNKYLKGAFFMHFNPELSFFFKT